MKRNKTMKTIGLIIIALLSLGGFYLYTQSNHTEDMHDHSGHQEESHEGHGHDSHEKEDSHDDHSGHDHHDHSKDHEENSVSHDEHDHDNHGHKDEHGHDEHEEGKTEIEPEHAKQAGVVLSKAQGGTISQNISLTVMNSEAKVILEKVLSLDRSGEQSFDLITAEWENGIYLVHLKGESWSQTRRVVVMK